MQSGTNHHGGGQRRRVFSKFQESYIFFAVTAQVCYLLLAKLKLSSTLPNDACERGSHNQILSVGLLGRFGKLLRHTRPDNEILQSIVPGSILSIVELPWYLKCSV